MPLSLDSSFRWNDGGCDEIKHHNIQQTHKRMIQKQPAVYILANKRNGTLYTGVTSNLPQRIDQHRNQEKSSSFVAKYKTYILVYAQYCDRMEYAIQREKQIKAWERKWKLELIEKTNPNWHDLKQRL